MKIWNPFKSRFNEHEFAEIMALLQSEDEEDFLLGKAILEAKNVKLGKDTLEKLTSDTGYNKRFIYIAGELKRDDYYRIWRNEYGIWQMATTKTI